MPYVVYDLIPRSLCERYQNIVQINAEQIKVNSQQDNSVRFYSDGAKRRKTSHGHRETGQGGSPQPAEANRQDDSQNSPTPEAQRVGNGSPQEQEQAAQANQVQAAHAGHEGGNRANSPNNDPHAQQEAQEGQEATQEKEDSVDDIVARVPNAPTMVPVRPPQYDAEPMEEDEAVVDRSIARIVSIVTPRNARVDTPGSELLDRSAELPDPNSASSAVQSGDAGADQGPLRFESPAVARNLLEELGELEPQVSKDDRRSKDSGRGSLMPPPNLDDTDVDESFYHNRLETPGNVQNSPFLARDPVHIPRFPDTGARNQFLAVPQSDGRQIADTLRQASATSTPEKSPPAGPPEPPESPVSSPKSWDSTVDKIMQFVLTKPEERRKLPFVKDHVEEYTSLIKREDKPLYFPIPKPGHLYTDPGRAAAQTAAKMLEFKNSDGSVFDRGQLAALIKYTYMSCPTDLNDPNVKDSDTNFRRRVIRQAADKLAEVESKMGTKLSDREKVVQGQHIMLRDIPPSWFIPVPISEQPVAPRQPLPERVDESVFNPLRDEVGSPYPQRRRPRQVQRPPPELDSSTGSNGDEASLNLSTDLSWEPGTENNITAMWQQVSALYNSKDPRMQGYLPGFQLKYYRKAKDNVVNGHFATVLANALPDSVARAVKGGRHGGGYLTWFQDIWRTSTSLKKLSHELYRFYDYFVHHNKLKRGNWDDIKKGLLYLPSDGEPDIVRHTKVPSRK